MNQADLNYEKYYFINQHEKKSFFKTAVTWNGSVTPVVIHRVILFMLYAYITSSIEKIYPISTFPISPFQYTGFALGVLLVLRVNAGLDRWWEARKLWGNIVNQSRNLSIMVKVHCKNEDEKKKILKYIAAWPYVIMNSLRNDSSTTKINKFLSQDDLEKMSQHPHRPSYIAYKLDEYFQKYLCPEMNSYVFHLLQNERLLLLNSVGACERIASTPIPFVLAIKIRRFILMFIILLPFCMNDKTNIYSAIIVGLVSYPLLSLDEIGVHLQNPFSLKSLSCLPLENICDKIYANISENNF
ncbi:bestrophin family protein [Pigmentibacter ruber]|nr:bestrophin family ion channel [Pigmentibacter ruber]